MIIECEAEQNFVDVGLLDALLRAQLEALIHLLLLLTFPHIPDFCVEWTSDARFDGDAENLTSDPITV